MLSKEAQMPSLSPEPCYDTAHCLKVMMFNWMKLKSVLVVMLKY